eukprot:TRINITY_DN1253_c0_g1_i1.p2 TRINITY_DN1253_c0_g1~~TRINITY_DN1253_c0_g1_i1.p2  ORF type:complete len:391 (-),score=93.71 TRINITY_DN1253_c0_g1_i1:1376-2548(-)
MEGKIKQEIKQETKPVISPSTSTAFPPKVNKPLSSALQKAHELNRKRALAIQTVKSPPKRLKVSGKKKKKQKRPKSASGSKRPLTAFFLFRQAYREKVQAENPGASVADVAKLLGAQWANISAEERAVYTRRAAADMANFKAAEKAGGVIMKRDPIIQTSASNRDAKMHKPPPPVSATTTTTTTMPSSHQTSAAAAALARPAFQQRQLTPARWVNMVTTLPLAQQSQFFDALLARMSRGQLNYMAGAASTALQRTMEVSKNARDEVDDVDIDGDAGSGEELLLVGGALLTSDAADVPQQPDDDGGDSADEFLPVVDARFKKRQMIPDSDEDDDSGMDTDNVPQQTDASDASGSEYHSDKSDADAGDDVDEDSGEDSSSTSDGGEESEISV